MIEKLGFLVRFRELKARHATLGEPLAAHEQVELLSLMQLVTLDFRLPEPGPVVRSQTSIPAQLIGEGAIVSIELRQVTASALLIAALRPITPGSRVIFRAADAVSGIEYAVPCTVTWVYDGSPCTMALAVDGIPMRSEFTSFGDARVPSSMAFGRAEQLVG